MGFKRARSDEQREERRRLILDTAASMLTEMPVSDLSLNELSRRSNLAKSALLRYFESREAVLLELLDSELRTWVDELALVPSIPDATARERGDSLASAIANGFARNPMLCDLISAQASVLERNVSTDVILRHKRSNLEILASMNTIVSRHLPELTETDAYKVTAYTLLLISASWPHSRPTAAVTRAYEADAEIAAMHMEFGEGMEEAVGIVIAGLISRRSPT